MPTYTFKNLQTGEVTEHIMKIAELDQFKADHPELERYICDAPSFGDPVRLGLIKPDAGFKEVLQKIADKTPGAKGLRDQIR
jgi:hypothetical protein